MRLVSRFGLAEETYSSKRLPLLDSSWPFCKLLFPWGRSLNWIGAAAAWIAQLHLLSTPGAVCEWKSFRAFLQSFLQALAQTQFI